MFSIPWLISNIRLHKCTCKIVFKVYQIFYLHDMVKTFLMVVFTSTAEKALFARPLEHSRKRETDL